MADLALTATSGTTTVPAGMYSATVRCIGPGGNGFNSASGAGGAYAEKVIAVSPGDVLSYQVGAGGSGNDTWFVSSSTVMAKAGPNATAFNAGGTAPAATSSVGTIRYKGGNGRTNGAVYGGYGGGGAAGPNGDGAQGGTSSSNSGGGGGGANTGASGGTGASQDGGDGGNGRGGTGSGAGGTGGNNINGSDATAGTGAGGGGSSGSSASNDAVSSGGNGAQENIWVVSAVDYGPGGGGGGSSGNHNNGGDGGGYGGGGGATGRNQNPNATAGLGSGGLIIIDWSTSPLQAPTSYAIFIGI